MRNLILELAPNWLTVVEVIDSAFFPDRPFEVKNESLSGNIIVPTQLRVIQGWHSTKSHIFSSYRLYKKSIFYLIFSFVLRTTKPWQPDNKCDRSFDYVYNWRSEKQLTGMQ